MSESEPQDHRIVPLGERGLVRPSSDLVRRGLDLALRPRENVAMYRANPQRNNSYQASGLREVHSINREFVERAPFILGSNKLVFAGDDGAWWIVDSCTGDVTDRIFDDEDDWGIPTLVGRSLYVASSSGLLRAGIEEESPTLLFEHKTNDARAWDKYMGVPLVFGDSIIIHTPESLFALGREGGRIRWHQHYFDREGWEESRASNSAFDDITTNRHLGYYAATDGINAIVVDSMLSAAAFDIRSGKVSWQTPAVTYNPSSPVSVGHGLAFLSLYDRLVALDLATGETRWTYLASEGLSIHTPVAVGNLVVAREHKNHFGLDNYLFGIDPVTGKQVWSTGGIRRANDPAIADGIVYVSTRNGEFLAYNELDGSLVWRFETGVLNTIGLAVGDGALWFASYKDGNIYQLT